MAIPDFQSVMLPLLDLLADGNEHLLEQYLERMADHFQVCEDEHRVLLPSGRQCGRQSLFVNRVGCASTYLVKAGLVQRTGRKRLRITGRGRQTLQEGPERINIAYLS